MENDSLPKGWVWTTIDDIAHVIQGQSPPSSTYNESHTGLPFYQGKLEFGELYPTPRKWCSSPTKISEKGDVLISVRAPVGPTNICPEKSCIGRGLAAVRSLGDIETLFVLYSLRAFEQTLSCQGTGTTFKAITGDKLRGLAVPLPPLPEQHRIVAKIEELFTRLDAGVEALKKIQIQLKRYRQSVLKFAFSGELTAEWRKAHKGELEPASVLLEKIKQERKKSGKYKEFPPLDTSDLPELTEGWIWTTSRMLSKFVTSGSRDWKRYYSDSGVLFIRTQDINKNILSLDNVARVALPENVEGKRSRVQKNDILIIITGANVGKVAVVDIDIEEAYVSQSVALLKLVIPEMAKFMQLALITASFGKTQIDKLVYGMGRPVLSLGNVQDIALPLPPILEQHEIISKVESLLSVVDKIENTLEQNLRQSERLRQSILKRAFEGKLVSQDPNDEAAKKLLEQIKAEKAQQQATVMTTRGGNRLNTSQGRLI